MKQWVADELHCGENSGVGRHAPVSDAFEAAAPTHPLLLCKKAAFFLIRRGEAGVVG